MLSPDIFVNPPATYRPIPFWFWNSKLTADKVAQQIHDFHEKGLGGFFIHARFGLETDYLSRDWMDCVKKAVATASELGMEVWLYDENGFPSGIGDLKVSRVREYRPKFITQDEYTPDSNGQINVTLPDGDVVLAYGFSPDMPGAVQTDLTLQAKNGSINWTAPNPRWKVAVFTKCTIEDPNDVVYGVDYLDVEAMRFFFDYTLTPYEQALGKYFGNVIKGIFTDEPTLLPWHHNGMWYAQREHVRLFPWNDAIALDLKSLHNLSLDEFLPHLFYNIDSATGHMRKLYQKSVTDLYMRSFFTPYKRWCEEHSMKLTGHLLLEEGLYYNTIFESNPFPVLSALDIPGTDHLGDVTEHEYKGIPNLPVEHTNIHGRKLASSASDLTGKGITISECYGCAGWGLTLERAKLIADWQYSLGINMLCPHAMFYSIEGFRKNDAPPAHNFLPNWKHYKQFADYIGRISYALRQGTHKARVALYYPLNAFHSTYSPLYEDGEARLISDTFDACCSLLPKMHLDYDIINDQYLAGCSVEDGHLLIGNESYDTLIAHSSAIRPGTRKLIEEFTSGGGKAMILTTSPGFQNLSGGSHISAQDVDYDSLVTTLKALLDHQIQEDPKINTLDGGPAEDIRYHRRQMDQQHVFFLANTGEKKTRFTLWTALAGMVEIWNPETGAISAPEEAEADSRGTWITLELAPYGSTIVVIDETKAFQKPKPFSVSRKNVITLSDEWEFKALEPNVLWLNDWKLSMEAAGGSQVMTYTTKFGSEFIPEKLQLMLDDIEYRSSLMGSMNLVVKVNDETFDRPVYGQYIDAGFKTLDISSAVLLGNNTISIKITHSPWAGQPQFLNAPPALLGDFTCSRDNKVIMPKAEAAMRGSWTECGYPFYSGTIEYSQGFKPPKLGKNTRLIIQVENARDCFEVLIDGKSAGTRLWSPWELDITDFVTHNRCRLSIRVSNSMSNFISMNPNPSGLLGSVKLITEVIL